MTCEGHFFFFNAGIDLAVLYLDQDPSPQHFFQIQALAPCYLFIQSGFWLPENNGERFAKVNFKILNSYVGTVCQKFPQPLCVQCFQVMRC